MISVFTSVAASPAEVAAARSGDEIVPGADVVMDRAFTVAAPPDAVWPWVLQLGKRRAGWYLPGSVERFIPRGRRALRHIDPDVTLRRRSLREDHESAPERREQERCDRSAVRARR
jgi:hypothetical protein